MLFSRRYRESNLHTHLPLKDPILRQILDRTLMQIRPQERERILHRWLHLGQNRMDQLKAVLPMLTTTLSVVLALILGVLLWNYTLTRQIRLRTRERLRDRIPIYRHLISAPLIKLFVPNRKDIELIELPGAPFLMYYLIRPFRLTRRLWSGAVNKDDTKS